MNDEDYVINDVYVIQPIIVEGVVEEDDNAAAAAADQNQCKLIRAIATITISTIVLILIYKKLI